MKIIEEKYLKRSISQLNKYVKEHQDFLDFFNESENMLNTPLQDLSFKSDLDFFDEVSFILSVISTIISHPHLLNKGEEIIIRAELAPQLTTDMFQKTIRDPQLWSEDGIDMIPEYVYHYQQIDELKIYENIFIVKLIKMLDKEIQKYNDFYISMIQIVNGSNPLTMSKDTEDIALKKMRLLNRKIKHIKNTYFYKVVSPAVNTIRSIYPTNILLKDRLYNYCYKFYKKLITYSDKQSITLDIRLYYFVQLIKLLKDLGYSLNNDDITLFKIEDGNTQIPYVEVFSEDFNITIKSNDEVLGLEVGIINNKVKNKNAKIAKHLLVFDSQPTFEDTEIFNNSNYNSITAMSLWNMAYVDGEIKVINPNPLIEKELIKSWLSDKLFCAYGSKEIYSEFCPSCKSQLIEMDDLEVIHCSKCNSKYTFVRGQKNSGIWFISLRRL